MATIGERIVEKALEILDASPEGVRYSDLIQHIIESDPSFNHNTACRMGFSPCCFRPITFESPHGLKPIPRTTNEPGPLPAVPLPAR
jgi:hypothetical protein